MKIYLNIDDDGIFCGYTSTSEIIDSKNVVYVGDDEDPNFNNDNMDYLTSYLNKKYNRETKEWEEFTEEEFEDRFGNVNEPSLEERMVAALEYYNLIVE